MYNIVASFCNDTAFNDYYLHSFVCRNFGRRPSAEFERYMNRHCRYWTFNDKQLQSVVSQFCGHYSICYCLYRSRGIDMRKIVCSFTSDTALNDVLVHALVCRIRKKFDS